MENNNEIMNEEVIEATEEIVTASAGNCLGKVATVGLAMIAGGLAYKFIVRPAAARFKDWRKTRQTVYVENEETGDEVIIEDFESEE